MGCGPLLQGRQAGTTKERAFDDAFLPSTPHPSGFARHHRVFARGQALLHFVEKGRETAEMFERDRPLFSRRPSDYANACMPQSRAEKASGPDAQAPSVDLDLDAVLAPTGVKDARPVQAAVGMGAEIVAQAL